MSRNTIGILHLFLTLQLALGSDEARNLLRGKHIRVLLVEVPPALSVTRNETGQITGMTGICADIFFLMQEYFNFTYSFIPTIPGEVFDDAGNKSGWKNYMIRKEADIAVGPLLLFASRLSTMDYSAPLSYDPYYILIPKPTIRPNFAVPWKPFTLTVWILLLISLLAIVATLTVTIWFLPMKSRGERRIEPSFTSVSWSSDYVIQVIMAQGGFCRSTRFLVRSVAGVWCAAAFFLVNFYYSTLTSYVSSPNLRPILERVDDVTHKPDVKVAVNRGWAIDSIFLAANTGTFKYVGDMLRKDDSLRCLETEKCLDKVFEGSTAFVTYKAAAVNIIEEEVNRRGKCRIAVADSHFLGQLIGFSFPKNSQIRRAFDAGVLELQSLGLAIGQVKPSYKYDKCMKKEKTTAKTQLGIKNLSSAFLVLLFGYGLAIIVFVAELFLKSINAWK